MMLKKEEQQALIADFKKAVSGLYGDRLAKVILFGSYARGDFHEDSDIDFLVLLKDEKVKRFSEIINMGKVVHPLILKHDIEISFHPMSLQYYNSENN
ncbi:MAG TPA: nucleotidyltransferase domain-containing protein, partial [Bacteroidetes bacterium]|nr:nucleotidyltransferase domain-containing protein [Bacteroidota bacterium]